MYYSAWGLEESPFSTDSKRAYHPSPTHEEALARLHFLVGQRRRFGMLLGPRGSGKSLTLSVFGDQCRQAQATVGRLNLTAMSGAEFPLLVAGQLDAATPTPLSTGSSTAATWRQLEDRFAEVAYERRSLVLLLDDAHRAHGDVFDQVRRIMNFDSTHGSPLTVVFAVPLHAAGQIPADFHELSALRITLDPWQFDDTHAFLSQVFVGKRGGEPVFDEDAVRRIQETAKGNPRRVVQLADLALLVGAGEHATRVGEQIVAKAADELVLAGES